MASEGGKVPGISILLVDDESNLLDIGKTYLEKTGDFAVQTALSAPEAIRLLSEQSYDAIVSDYQMPEMDGITFLKQVRSDNKTIPFILFTGKGREEIVVEAFENGANFYIQKGGAPKAQFAELVHKICAAIDQRRSQEQVMTLNRLYTVLSTTHKAVVRIHDKKALLNEICRIVIEIGGLKMAWAGLANPKKKVIEPTAAYGHIDGYLETIAISTADIPRGRGPTGTAFREGKFNVCNDVANDPKMAPWRDGALERGYHSIAAFPFALDTKNAGVITFYSSETGFFNDSIIQLLDEKSKDIASALQALDNEELRINAENELKKSELRYRRLFETAQDAILILDGDTGEIIDANKFIIDMLGYPLEYFVGKYLWELGFIKDISIAQHAFTELKTIGYIRYEDIPLETKDGRSMDVEFVSNIYLVGDKKIIQCNIRDITARKRAEDALRQANKQLNLLSNITRHDILSQLITLKGYLVLSQEVIDNPETLSGYIKKEQQAANAIEHQIMFTKDYQELGSAAPAWQNVNANIQKAVAGLPMREIHVDIDRVDLEIFSDPLFEKVFYNLIDNALRYGGDQMKIIRVFSQEIDTELLIVCEDDGDGVPAEEKETIFERGYGKNTGMGLFLSREILTITGIRIKENGEPGKGARFEITVPKGMYRFSAQEYPANR